MSAETLILGIVVVFCLGPLVGCILGFLLFYPFGRVAALSDERMERAARNYLDGDDA